MTTGAATDVAARSTASVGWAMNTGGLLAHERLTLSPARISAYRLILRTDWTNQVG
jgi:hypothetical protein